MPKKATTTKQVKANKTTVQKNKKTSLVQADKDVLITKKAVSKKRSQKAVELTVVDVASNSKKRNIRIKCSFARERVLTEVCDAARELYNQSSFGTVLEDGKVQLSLTEALYLMEKKKIFIVDGRNQIVNFEKFVRRASKVEPNFWIRYAVYKDMRNRGYIIKTALKFGADFRVYDRGIKPGQDHARWIVYPVHEGEKYTWFDFAAKNRVAHSTKKRLMMGVVDDENDVTYWEIRWVRP